jgi:hypothetical protein
MRNAILPAAAVLLLGGAAMAQTGIDSGTTLNQGSACSSFTDADARTRCLNEMQLHHRDTTSGGLGGTGINSGASSSGSIESNRAGAENAVPGVGAGVNTGVSGGVNTGTGAGVNTGANTGVNTGADSRALGGDASGGLSAGGSVGTSDRHR